MKVFFLHRIEDYFNKFKCKVYELLRDNLDLHTHYNLEVSYLWYALALKAKQSDVLPYVDTFLSKTGRLSYICPIYRAYKNFNEEKAKAAFQANK